MTISNNGPRDATDYLSSLERLDAELDAAIDAAHDSAGIGALNDKLAAIRGVGKKAEADRVAIKAPHKEAADAVDAEFRPVKVMAKAMQDRGKAHVTQYLKAEAAKEAEERRKRDEEAAAAAAIAERMSDNAVVGGVLASDAEAAAKRAKAAAKAETAARRTGSASGATRSMALRTTYSAIITDPVKAAQFFACDPVVAEVVQKAANAYMRSGETRTEVAQGFELHVEQKAA